MNYDNRFNTKIKVYPDGNFKATYCNKCIFANPQDDKKIDNSTSSQNSKPVEDWEISLRTLENDNMDLKSITAKELEIRGITTFQEFLNMNKPKKKSSDNSAINLERSLKRAKERIFDIAYINDFKYFVTVNFNPDLVNSRNAKDVIKKMRVWLSNQKQRYGMEYILVPEYHPDSYDKVKDRIHCHLLITDYPDSLLVHAPAHKKGGGLIYNKDGSVKRLYSSQGQKIYNMLGWKYGFSTCIPVYKAVNDSNVKLAHYITKYMTKDVHKIFGKFYWSSKGLKRDVDVELFNSDYDSLPLKEYEIPNTNIRLKYDSQFNYTIGENSNEKKE